MLGAIGGSVISAPTGINCGSSCNQSFVGGTSVTFSVAPGAVYTWSVARWVANVQCTGAATLSGSITVTIT